MLLPALLSASFLSFLAAIVTPDLKRLGFRGTNYPLPAGQVRLLGLALGGILTAPLILLLGVLGAPTSPGLLLILPVYVTVISRYVNGWPRGTIGAMERELPSLSAFVLSLAGMGQQPIPKALEVYREQFPDRPLSILARRTPPGQDPVAFVLSLGVPSVTVNGVFAVLLRAQNSPHRREALERLHRAQERRAQLDLERVIEGRVSTSPVATVLLLFPALLATALVPVMVRFIALLGAI